MTVRWTDDATPGTPYWWEALADPAQSDALPVRCDLLVIGAGYTGLSAAIAAHEHDLLNYTPQKLSAVDGVRLIGTAAGKVSVISFVMDCAHPHDIATIVDRTGVAIRAGHHCAQPLIDRFEIPSAARASFGMYNTRDDADRLVASLEKVKEIFAR